MILYEPVSQYVGRTLVHRSKSGLAPMRVDASALNASGKKALLSVTILGDTWVNLVSFNRFGEGWKTDECLDPADLQPSEAHEVVARLFQS